MKRNSVLDVSPSFGILNDSQTNLILTILTNTENTNRHALSLTQGKLSSQGLLREVGSFMEGEGKRGGHTGLSVSKVLLYCLRDWHLFVRMRERAKWISNFSHCCVEIPGKSNLKKKALFGFIV